MPLRRWPSWSQRSDGRTPRLEANPRKPCPAWACVCEGGAREARVRLTPAHRHSLAPLPMTRQRCSWVPTPATPGAVLGESRPSSSGRPTSGCRLRRWASNCCTLGGVGRGSPRASLAASRKRSERTSRFRSRDARSAGDCADGRAALCSCAGERAGRSAGAGADCAAAAPVNTNSKPTARNSMAPSIRRWSAEPGLAVPPRRSGRPRRTLIRKPTTGFPRPAPAARSLPLRSSLPSPSASSRCPSARWP